MRPDNKSESFSFHRNSFAMSSDRTDSRIQNCRQKLQDKFESSGQAACTNNSNVEAKNERKVLAGISLNETRRAFKTGAERLSKTFTSVRTTFGTISQKFKTSTKRRQILEEGPMTPNCATPHTYSRAVLGRTPEQMSSPFGIEGSPAGGRAEDKENETPFKNQQKASNESGLWLKKRNLLDSIVD